MTLLTRFRALLSVVRVSSSISISDKAKAIVAHPRALGRALGYNDFTALHEEWILNMLTATDDMTLQAHRGSYKTTCLCIVIALLMIFRREQNIIFLRKTDSDVAEVVSNVDRILRSQIMQEIYLALTGSNLLVLKSTSTEITTSAYAAPKGSAQLLGIGIGGSLTGKHADIIITDDIVNLKDRISRAEREHTKAVYQELQNIKNRGGRIINTGTPWHKEDCFTLMPDAKKYDCYSTHLLNEEQIEKLRQSMSPSLFAANYELKHIASENALFTTSPTFTNETAFLRDGIAHIDAAYGGEDYTAFTCARRVGDKLYMYGKLYHKHVDLVLDSLIADANRLQCAPILCEANADKGFLAKEIASKGSSARTYHEKENKYIKISTYLRKWWSSIVFLDGTDADYIAQILDYTEDAEHDDAADSASVVCRYYDKRNNEAYVSPFH